MNSSKMSLKEGCDFLFENEEDQTEKKSSQKWTVNFNPEETKLSDVSSKLAFILTTDIISSVVNGSEETPIQKIFNNPEESQALEYAIGKTISIRKLEKLSRNAGQFSKLFNMSEDNVSGPIKKIAAKYNHCIANLFTGHNIVGMLLVENKEKKRIKISVRAYSRFVFRMKSSNIIPKDKRQKKTINLNKIWEFCLEAINRGELVKDGLDIEFKEASKQTQLLYSIKSFLSELTPYQRKSFGVSALKIFMQDLSNEKPIEKSYQSFQNNMSKNASVLNRKIMDAFVKSIIGSDSEKEAVSQIDKFSDIVPEENQSEESIDVLKDELDEFLTTLPGDDLPAIDFGDEIDSRPQKSKDDLNSIDSQDIDKDIAEAEDILKGLEEDFSNLEKECNKPNKDEEEITALLKNIADLLGTLIFCKSALEFALESNKSSNKINDNQIQEFEKVILGFESVIGRFKTLFEKLKEESTDPKSLSSDFTTVAFDPNTVSRIDFSEIAPELNKDEVITKAETEFEDIKTQIGVPTPQTDASSRDDEAKTTDDDQYKVTTTLEQPRNGDYNDFLRKYLAIASFLAITTDASSEILSDSSRRLKAGELVNILKKWSKQAKVDNDVLSNSISNLAKFTHKNVEGIIFERAGANKYFIKMKAGEFASSSLLLQKQMKEDMPQDCFQFIQAFPTPVFELTDSKGEAFYPDITSALNHFMGTNNQKRSLERVDDRIEFLVEGKRYFQFTTDGVDYVFSLLGKSKNKTLATENDQYFINADDIFGLTATDICKGLNIRDSKNAKIIEDLIDEYAKTKVDDFRTGLSEVDIDLSEDDAKTLVDAITTDPDDSDDQPKTQTLVSKGKDKPEIKNNISSVEELSNDKVVRKMMSAIYRDGSLNNFLATMTPVEFAAVKAGKDKRLISDFKARAILAINPELGAIKLNVKDIYNGEMKEVFDTLFSKNYNFDESAMRAAYTKTIVSAFDKLIGKEHSRITEGLFSGIKRMAAAGVANLAKMAPVIALVKAITFIPFVGAAIPFIMAGFVSWITFSSWKDIAKWEQAKRDYQDDPYRYIEKTLFEDKSSKKVIKNIVNAAAADVIVARLNPVFAKQSQKTVTAGISGGASEFQKNFDEQMSEFNSLSEEDRRSAKALNDRVIGQLAKTKYYNSVITEAMINMVFNEVMFGKNRVSNETRKMLLDGNFDMQSDARKDLQDTLVSVIKKSAIKNNLIDFVHKEVKKLENKRFTKADDAELERRKRYGSEKDIDTTGMGSLAAAKAKIGAAMSDNVVGGMYAQYFISPEQIHEEAIDELVQKVVGLSKKEYEKRFEYNKNTDLFGENIISGSLAKLLFEADQDVDAGFEGASEDQSARQKELQDEREEANKQKDNTAVVLAALGAGSYVHSLWFSMFMRKYSDKQIVKYILQTIPGKAATAAKTVFKFVPDPASAANDNLLGQDMGHGLFEFTHNGVKKQLYAYYYSEAKYAGTPKALSGQLIDPATGKAKMLQHNLYEYYLKYKSFFTDNGMEVTKKGIVKVINPKLCKALGANSPEMAKATNIIMTNLEGSYPVETKAALAKITTFDIEGQLKPLIDAAGGNMSEFAEYTYKVLANQMGLEGNHVIPQDQMYKAFFNHWRHLLNKASTSGATAKEKAANWDACKSAIENFMKGMQRLEDNFDIGKEIASSGADLKAEADNYAKAVDQLSKPVLEKISSMYTEEVAQKTMVKAIGAVAQQGHNPMLDFDVIPGQAGTASQQQQINARHTIPGDKGFFNSLSKGVADYNSVVGPLALASKVLSKFWTRGIKSGELARQLTKMLNFESIVYTDILNVMIGNNIASVPQGLTKGGHAENQSLSPNELMQQVAQVQSTGSVKITDLNPTDFEGEQAPAAPRSDESYVHNTKLSSYLFENRLVTKRKKASKIKNKKLVNEINEHKKLQDMFKNMF